MIITFLYRIKGIVGRFYGKYIGKCPTYEEGLDRALLGALLPLFQELYPSVSDEEDISLGVLVADREAKDYYSEEEKSVFDLLYCKGSVLPVEAFFNGVPVKCDKGI